MTGLPLLSIVTFLPLLGALFILLFVRDGGQHTSQNARWTAMWCTIGTFILSLPVLFGFDPSNTDFQFVEESNWLGVLNYKLGVDGISILFVMLILSKQNLCLQI